MKKNSLKRLCLNEIYCCSGEIYKILNSDCLNELISQISNKNISLLTDAIYGRKYMTGDECFLSILDKYIGYVRDTYFIRHYELVYILEETLKSKYNVCLLESLDIHCNVDFFCIRFKQMFLDMIVSNTISCAKLDIDHKYSFLNKAYTFLCDKDLNKKSDLEKIEQFMIKVINNRKDNLINCFKYLGDKNEFYMKQLNWLYEDYYQYGSLN